MPVTSLSEITGLETALAAKANAADVSTGLAGKQNAGSYAAASHNHDGVYALADHTHEGGGSDPWTWAKLGSDVSNSTTTLATSNLSFTATANTTYLVQAYGAFQSAATTTGIAAALDIPSGSVIGQFGANTTATAWVVTEQVADNATTSVTTGVRAANTNTPCQGWWIVAVGASGGTVTLNFRSEVASSAVTLKANLTALGYRTI